MKRFTIYAVVLGSFVVAMLIARPALTDQQSEKKTSELTKLQQLQKERIEIYEKIVPMLKRQYESLALPFEDFAKAQDELIEAKLDATDKPEERIAFLEEQLKVAQSIVKFVQEQTKSGRDFPEIVYLLPIAHRLSIEIKLAKEQSGKKM